jgi:hypothetical protein
MDVLFYSNYCKHSKQLIHFVATNRLADKFSAICVDNRFKDDQTTVIVLDNGNTYKLPVHVHSVPTLLLVSQKHRILVGEEIYRYLKPLVEQDVRKATEGNMEPVYLSSSSSLPTFLYNENRQPSTYVSANHDGLGSIPTPDLNAKVAKMGNVSLEDLQMMREKDIRANVPHDQIDFGAMPGNSYMPQL